jgi:Mor family transcriptional regulator
MDFRRTGTRNREIFARFQAGQSVESLAQQHGLSVDRVRSILVDESNRRTFSPEPFYRALRGI